MSPAGKEKTDISRRGLCFVLEFTPTSALGSRLYIYKQIKYKKKTALEIYLWLLKLVAYYYYRKIDSL